ncbi:hypothetical protein DRJ16_07695, partial [Candidatus Woesearchaeota archaeon]
TTFSSGTWGSFGAAATISGTNNAASGGNFFRGELGLDDSCTGGFFYEIELIPETSYALRYSKFDDFSFPGTITNVDSIAESTEGLEIGFYGKSNGALVYGIGSDIWLQEIAAGTPLGDGNEFTLRSGIFTVGETTTGAIPNEYNAIFSIVQDTSQTGQLVVVPFVPVGETAMVQDETVNATATTADVSGIVLPPVQSGTITVWPTGEPGNTTQANFNPELSATNFFFELSGLISETTYECEYEFLINGHDTGQEQTVACTNFVTLVDAPDLTAGCEGAPIDFPENNSGIVQGNTTDINVYAGNYGGAATPEETSFDVILYDPSMAVIDSWSESDWLPNSCWSANVKGYDTSELSLGPNDFTLKVDEVGIIETDNDPLNNEDSTTLNVIDPASAPNLATDSFTFNPPSPAESGTTQVDVTCTVINNGNGATGGEYFEVCLYDDMTSFACSGDSQVLGIGSTVDIGPITYDITQGDGTYNFYCYIDQTYNIAETNEEDNTTGTDSFVVGEGGGGGPDLVITNLTFDQDPIPAGEILTVNINVLNQGDVAAIGTIDNQFSDDTAEYSDSCSIESLDAGFSDSCDVFVDTTGFAEVQHNVTCTTDISEAFVETDEENNTYSTSYTVEAGAGGDCQYSLELSDIGADGWSGGYVEIVVDGGEPATYILEEGDVTTYLIDVT